MASIRLIARWWLARATRQQWDWVWIFAGSTIVVALGVALGQAFIPPGNRPAKAVRSQLDGFVRWDATYYRDIAALGYVHRPGQSPVHFPPAYPLVSWCVRAITGWPIEWAMVLTSHACLAASLALLAGYTGRRHGQEHPGARPAAIIAAGFFPAGMFFHMGYSESLFLLVCISMLCLIRSEVSPAWVACLAAVGFATRFVGIALALPALTYAWQYGRGGWRSAGWVVICLPLALSGVAGLMWYHHATSGDPLLFARSREDLWRMRESLPVAEKVATLAAFEPVWGVFVPGSPFYWGRYCKSPGEALFSIYPANPVVFALALGLAGWGLWKNLLTRHEAAMTASLLVIPYWIGGYDSNMVSMARYTTVVAPLYPVAGILLARGGTEGLAGFAGCGATLMAIYAARFSQNHWII